MRWPIVLTALLLCAPLVAARAAADVTATFAPVTPSYTGSCPATMKFSGSIVNGTAAGASGTYTFTHSDGSPSGLFPFHLAAGAKLPITDSYAVAASGTGTLAVTYSASSLSATITAAAPFTVTCATPTPTPSATPTHSPTPTPTPTPVSTPTPSPTPTPTPSPSPSPTPVSGGLRALATVMPSPTPTPTLAPGSSRLIFKPANYTTRVAIFSSHAEVQGCDQTALPGLLGSTMVDEVLVGYDLEYQASGKCWQRTGRSDRGAVWFGDFIKGKKVLAATLSFHVTRSSSTSQGHPLSGNVSCAGQLMTAQTPWMNESGSPSTFAATPFLTLPADRPGDSESFGGFSILNGLLVSIDVTRAVSDWSQGGRPNYGFVLTPPVMESSAQDRRCASYYAGFTLTVDVANATPKPGY
ncbi:MAG TPA: hypothetical protein VN934_11910 [Candidatus Tumulicola sp.]|nr:hypothetical protein [Candidatus Tumulicola sp.]